MTKVSVIIPVYNVEKYISQCLNSIINQSLNDIEIICVNDGSTDSSSSILEQYAHNDNRIKIINQVNQGQGVARNNAIKQANGEYIVFVDPDDWLVDGALEKIYKFISINKADVIQFNYINYYEENKIKKYDSAAKNFKKLFHYDLLKNKFYICKNLGKNCLANMSMVVWNKAYSTNFIKQNNIHFAPSKHAEDHLFTLMSLLNTDKIYYLDEYLYYYRTAYGSAMNKSSDENFCIFDNIKLLKDFLVDKNLYSSLEEEYKHYTIDVLVWHYNYVKVESQKKYKLKAKTYLSKDDYLHFLRKINQKSILETFFSLRNVKRNAKKVKVLTILGLEFNLWG